MLLLIDEEKYPCDWCMKNKNGWDINNDGDSREIRYDFDSLEDLTSDNDGSAVDYLIKLWEKVEF